MPAAKKSSKKVTEAKKTPASSAAVAKPPTYQVMVQEAIKALKEPKGASRQAMKKYVMSEYKLDSLSLVHFNGALKKLTKGGTLEQSKNGHRWKIAKTVTPKPVSKKSTVKKPAAKKVVKKSARKDAQQASPKSARH